MLNKSISLGWRSCLRSLPYWGRKWGGWSQDEEGPIYVNTGLDPFPHQIWKATEELQVADSMMKSRKYLAVSLPPIWSLPSLGWKDWGPMLIQFFFFFGEKLLYNFVLVSVIQQCKSVIIIHIFLPSWASLPSPIPPSPRQLPPTPRSSQSARLGSLCV